MTQANIVSHYYLSATRTVYVSLENDDLLRRSMMKFWQRRKRMSEMEDV